MENTCKPVITNSLLTLGVAALLTACGGSADMASVQSTKILPKPTTVQRGAVLAITPTSPSVQVGQTVPLTARVTANGSPSPQPYTVQWSSRNAAVATVDRATGLVSGIAPGVATVTAATTTGNLVASTEVTVTAPPVTSISINFNALTVGDPLSTQYSTQGIQFSGGTVAAASSQPECASSQSGEGAYAEGNIAVAYGTSIEITLDPATTGTLDQLAFLSCYQGQITVEMYATDGSLIYQASESNILLKGFGTFGWWTGGTAIGKVVFRSTATADVSTPFFTLDQIRLSRYVAVPSDK